MVNHSMRKLCPNLDKEDGLETVLEVPIPEEMFNKMGSNAALRWHNMRNLMRAHHRSSPDKCAAANPLAPTSTSNNDQFMLLLKLVGSAFIPCRIQLDHALTIPIKDATIGASTAKYIVQQYLAATGGLAALNAINSMYAIGQVKMHVASEAVQNTENAKRNCEAGGFVLWQKNPDLWYLELVLSGHKISAGSDGKIGWSQSSSNSNATRGPPRPLRRFFQGLDPRLTAHLFLNTVCIENWPPHPIRGHKTNTNEDGRGDDSVFYETSMESALEDYRPVDGINIAHSGRTTASLYRYGKTLKRKWKLEETWKIEEVDFNICGLSFDYFLPPADDRKDNENDEQAYKCC
ncbi:hypothetical protein Sango_2131600 [Sesamum angolense]|uniref:Uncharacterized protein n=1 Tax=Sesamum angolense TaxID=2727404 RepID=A0AAE1WCB0_9LAMI|nr:hypothetical protein Sango_2131600 [Sesamum angolense]